MMRIPSPPLSEQTMRCPLPVWLHLLFRRCVGHPSAREWNVQQWEALAAALSRRWPPCPCGRRRRLGRTPSSTAVVVHWPRPEAAPTIEACLEAACRCLHHPVPRWTLSCVDGRTRDALLSPLSLLAWDGLVAPDDVKVGDAQDFYHQFFLSVRDALDDPVFRTGDPWLSVPWWDMSHATEDDDDDDQPPAGHVAWCLRFGPLLVAATEDRLGARTDKKKGPCPEAPVPLASG